MYYLRRITCAALVLGACSATAGDVPSSAIHDFSKGDTLKAGDLNGNFEALRSAVTDNASTRSKIQGFQETSFSNPVEIKTATWTQIQSLTIQAGSKPANVSFNAHLVVEGGDLNGSDRYRFGICKGSASDANLVGAAWWRPASTSNTYQSMTISFTGFDQSITQDVTYSLCGAKLNSVDQGVTVYRRGLTATVAPR